MSEKIIVYGHPFCPMVMPVLKMLESSDVDFEYINIRQDLEARDRVTEINNGNESVPTLVFPDDSTLTEPSSGALKSKLEEFGYTVPITAQIYANAPMIIVGIIVFLVLLQIVAGL
jgi:mycoredoxin